MAKAQRQVLPVTFWFDPAPLPASYPVTVRFTGRRLNLEGKPQRRDRFVHDETVAEVISGSGPISVTALVPDVHPGAWEVSAQILRPAAHTHPPAGPSTQGATLTAPIDFHPVSRFWQRWVPSVGDGHTVKTCRTPYARVPGALPLSWISLVVLGMVLALVTQALVVSRERLAVGASLLTTVAAIGAGIVGAKVWFLVKHRAEHLIDGWCIQGFITGASIAAAVLLLIRRAPVGVLLDASAPGLLVGLAVGRLGCFFAGCCGGPLTAARWGIWSSDQRVGGRRIPTQLMESGFSFLLALLALTAILWHGPRGGAYFVAVLAAYTLGRELLLDLRLEQRQKLKLWGVAVVSALATLVLVAALVLAAL
jgi:phosphatidylglycerol---prolipoprotein diacylglyceryl transferase